MSVIKIRNIALSHFANYGYEGASLNEIAKEVGIKKPTIYSHYKGKDDLFFSCVKYVFHLERRKILLYFQSAKQKPIKNKLQDFFVFIEKKFNQSDSAKFLLRIFFFPPWCLRFELAKIVNSFINGMERLLVKLLNYHQKNGELYAVNINKAANAYITLVDGVIIELLYTGKNVYLERVNIAFPIYWQGIKSMNKE